MRDTQQDIRDAWAKVEIPHALKATYGEFEIWDYDGRVSRPIYCVGMILDREGLWVIASNNDGSHTAAAISFTRQMSPDIRILLQTLIDQWERLSHPFKEGDVLPQPERLFFERTEDGQMLAQPAPVTLSTTLNDRSMVYFYDRRQYRIERVNDLCSELQEAFRLVEK